MEIKEINNISIPLSHVRRVVNSLKLLPDETKISFEYILSAFFPTVWTNIKKAMNDCYTKGYINGLKDGKNEN